MGFLQGWENQLGPIVLWILSSECALQILSQIKSFDWFSNGLGSGFIVIGVLSIGNQFAIMWQPDGFQRKNGRRPIDLKEHNQDLLIKVLLGDF